MKNFRAYITAFTAAFLMAAQPAHALISVAEKNAREARKHPSPTPSTRRAATSPLDSQQAPASDRPFVVVIDPGHGGIDHGTSYPGYAGNPPVAEKDLTLMLARQVAARLKALGGPKIEVVLTRDGDYEMPLSARTAMANRLKADLFLSIHLNSIPGARTALAEGVETYILNHESDSTSKRLAQLENQVMGGESEKQPEDVALILKDLRLDASLPRSKLLACLIQQQVMAVNPSRGQRLVTSNRGVRQALFFVLLGADMPSALIEAGFLSNPRDRAWLLSVSGQKAFAQAVARAILRFRAQENTPQAQKILSSCKVH